MIRKYAYYVIPKLPSKNALSKIINANEKFYDERKTQLKYFINYLYYHIDLGQSSEFKKFINDLEFDDLYFKSNDTEYNHILEYNYVFNYNHLSNRIIDVFSTFFKNKEEECKDTIDNEEIEMLKFQKEYKELQEKYKELKAQMVNL